MATLVQEALEFACGNQPEAKGPRPTEPPYESQLGFIDGDRGSGKSSLLHFLDRIMAAGDRDAEVDALLPSGGPILELFKKRRSVFWLETLDMETRQGKSNLFGAILVRIEQAFALGEGSERERIDERQCASHYSSRAYLYHDDRYRKLLGKLRELQHRAIIGWDGYWLEKQDPHAYSMAVLERERAELRLSHELRCLLNELVNAHCSHPVLGGRELLVLPVDDFDLAPCRCLELLRLIRWIWAPRLFFLVAGNVRLAEDVLRFQHEGELRKLKRRQDNDDEIARVAHEVGTDNIRKLIPHANRAVLRKLEPRDAIGLKIDSLGTPESDLASVLEAVRFDNHLVLRRSTKATKRILTNLKKQLFPDDTVLPNGYIGAKSLRCTARELVDVAHNLRHWASKSPVERDDQPELLQAIAANAMSAAIKGTQLGARDRAYLEQLPRSLGEGSLRIGTRIKRRLTTLTSLIIPQAPGRSALGSPRLIGATQVELDWLRDEAGAKLEALPRRVGATLTLIHDLALQLEGVGVRGVVATEASPYVRIQWGEDKRDADTFWQFPDWPTYRERQLFHAQWVHLMGDQAEVESIEQVGQAWLTAMLTTLCGETTDGLLDWPALSKRVAELAKLAAPKRSKLPPVQHRLLVSSLRAIAGLLAPECGLATEATAEILNHLGDWLRGNRLEIIEARAAFATQISYLASSSTQSVAACHQASPEWVKRHIEAQARGALVNRIEPIGPTEVAGLLADPSLSSEARKWLQWLKNVHEQLLSHPYNDFESGLLVPSLDEAEDVYGMILGAIEEEESAENEDDGSAELS